MIPPQGFRHAATLLLSGGARRIAADAPPEAISEALVGLADELLALSQDMRARSDAREWLLAEFARTVHAVPARFDVSAVKERGARILARVGTGARAPERRDLFLIYAPEDRLPVAAPLAIELAKRRVTVGFSEYEVATPGEMAAAVGRGLRHHRAGAVLVTAALMRVQLPPGLTDTDTIRMIDRPQAPEVVMELVEWVRYMRSGDR